MISKVSSLEPRLARSSLRSLEICIVVILPLFFCLTIAIMVSIVTFIYFSIYSILTIDTIA